MIHIQRELIVRKPIKDVWAVLYGDFVNVGKWASGIYHSRPGTPEEGLDRVCDTFTGTLYEKFNFVDEENHMFEVNATGLPFFVTNTTGSWSLDEIDESTTKAVFEFKINTKGVIGTIMQIPMKSRLNKGVDRTLDDIKTYIETGEVTERKARELSESDKN
jgi:hypothetical protein